MAKPRGYTEVNVSLTRMDTPANNDVVKLLACDKCGGVVLFPMQHGDWHKKNDKK